MSRPTIIAGNWKMYKTIEEATSFVEALIPKVEGATCSVYLAVPFTAIQAVSEIAKGSKVIIGAQNMNDASEGAFTGEVAALMLKNAGAQFVILGHSERRRIFHEDNAYINRKVKRAFVEELQPLLCVGETLEEREAKQTEKVLSKQLEASLADITAEQLGKMVLAYEPVWAIGTNETATPKQAQEAHKFCRAFIEKKWNAEVAAKLPILYGGSVKPLNSKELIEQTDIDGLLVGGASLSLDYFSQIVDNSNVKIEGSNV